MQKVVDWALSRFPRETARANEAERLDATMKITAVNRYNASNRLKAQGIFTFFTTTILSLGLIFIPLMQLADAHLALPERLLDAIQIFLAVSILVYSVIIGTARYDLRSEQLNDCGDNIKELIRELRREKEAAGGQVSKEKLAELQNRYSSITTDVENHTRNDYRLTVLQLPEMFKVTGFVRVGMWGVYWATFVIQFLPSLMLLAIVLAFILEVFGITSGLSLLFRIPKSPNG
jgi:hypothetical protein